MTEKQLKIKEYDTLIEKLDNEFKKHCEEQENIELTGSKEEIFQKIGEKTVAESRYLSRRNELVFQKESLETEVSPHVEAYVDSQKNNPFTGKSI